MESANSLSPRRLSAIGASQKSRRQSYAGQSLSQDSAPPGGQLKRVPTVSGPVSALDNLQMYRLDANHRGSSSSASRRTSRNEDAFTCSQQSILSAMDRFVRSVNNMDATVLVPSRLRDMDLTDKAGRAPPANLMQTDLYSFYNMLNDVKNELLWGPSAAATSAVVPLTGALLRPPPKHTRQPSDDSLGSTGSTSDTDSDVDSVVTDRDGLEQSLHLAAAFRHHLQGLHAILHQLADSADYLACRYQEEVDASAL
ncbi:mid1-interacting protein 1A [Dermacentor andersoni]|uniref:mid1-interacting protein 1A n=2 Tax=Dermacentor TaxID=34619 RepID=UPI002154F893|nr:mid1-interacting protein 1A-like [Dermacentor andersoni]